ncbi:MAG TPA: CsbD family protein [Longimicrobiales bacterium]|nr:CsbD family protein [Longimicrobiales bacterium]
MTERKLRRAGLKNQIEGAKDELVGNVKGDAGDALDDGSMHARGRVQQAKGKVQRKFGEAQEHVADEVAETRRESTDDR